MNNQNANGGGKFKTAADLQGQEIEFPVKYNLKAVLPADREDNTSRLEKVLNDNKIKFSFLNKKVSSKGTYASYTYEVDLESKQQMDQLYSDLHKLEGLKFAV